MQFERLCYESSYPFKGDRTIHNQTVCGTSQIFQKLFSNPEFPTSANVLKEGKKIFSIFLKLSTN